MRSASRSSVRIRKAWRTAIYACGFGVWLSGGWWLLLHYFGVKQGEFGPEANPLESWALKTHGAFAFGAIWLFGLLWGVHVTVAWPRPKRRISGALLTATLIWLTLTGYLLYYVGSDVVRSVASLAHWGVGLALPVLYGLHRMRRRKPARLAGLRARQGEPAA